MSDAHGSTSPSGSPRPAGGVDRRTLLALLGASGFGLVALGEEAPPPRMPREAVVEAEKLLGLTFTDAERELMLEDLQELVDSYGELRAIALDNAVAPAFDFDPRPPAERAPAGAGGSARLLDEAAGAPPADRESLLDWPLHRLAPLVRDRVVSSRELTAGYLARLRERGPALECVVHLTEARAMAAAERADRELAAGAWRGPLHGIPWGAKDLLAARGAPTTWGAVPFRDQVLDLDATVVERLERAGAVLVAKLSLGALAWGDVWFGGTTKNPWNLAQGSSGSSAGSASATAAALVGFAIGSETWGSIVSPATRCGSTGLRPTFGRVSRHGAMALSWTMDKLGPIARSVEDCALVFDAIRGADGRDPSAIDAPFSWPVDASPAKVRVGYLASAFEEEREDAEWKRFDLASLDVLRGLGYRLEPIALPEIDASPLALILSVEAAAAFDELTRSNRDDLLTRQVRQAWPNVFRQARFIPAVEYVQANRVRSLLRDAMARLFGTIDVYVTPTYGGGNLLLTNLTGHPSVVLPNGLRADGTPTSITLTGGLFDEGRLLAVARALQEATDFHLRRPPYPYPRREEEKKDAAAG